MAAVLKTVVLQGTGGSNPSPSATAHRPARIVDEPLWKERDPMTARERFLALLRHEPADRMPLNNGGPGGEG